MPRWPKLLPSWCPRRRPQHYPRSHLISVLLKAPCRSGRMFVSFVIHLTRCGDEGRGGLLIDMERSSCEDGASGPSQIGWPGGVDRGGCCWLGGSVARSPPGHRRV